MSFLSDVVQPNQLSNINSKPVVSGGFLSSVIKPQQANTQQQIKPNIIENPKGDGYPALNPDGSQVTPDSPVSDPFGISRIQNSPIAKGYEAVKTFLGENKKLPAVMANPLSTTNKDTFLNTAGQEVQNSLNDTHDRINKAIDTWKSPTATGTEKGVSTASAGLGIFNSLISGITGTLKGAETIPGVGQVAHVVNTVFGAAGAGGGAAASQAVQNIPDTIISPKTKAAITPLATELGALATQIAIGKGGDTVKTDIANISKAIIKHVKNEPISVPVTSEGGVNNVPIDKSYFNKTEPQVLSNAQETKIPISTPVSRAVDYNKKMGYEPITPTEQLPIIQVGKNKSELPTIQTVPKEPTQLGSYKYEPIKETSNVVKGGFLDTVSKPETVKEKVPSVTKATSPQDVLPKSSVVPKTAPQQVVAPKVKEVMPIVEKTQTIKEPVTNLSSQKVSKVGTSIETKSIEKGLTQGFGDTAGYDPITIKDQAERASKLMNEDIQKARDMVTGKIPMESGLKGEMLIKAMEDHAEKTGNVDLMRDIAKSPLVSETSAHAQAMRILAERNPDSVVAKLNEIKKAREASVEKKTGKKISEHTKETVKEIKQSMKVTVPKKEDWNSFIKSIQC